MEHEFITLYCVNCGHEHQVPRACSDRFCPICGRIRLHRTSNRLKQILKSPNRAKNAKCIKHLTLTMRNCADIEVMCHDIVTSFKRLRKTSMWRNKVKGGAFFIEITGRPESWHVHLHVLIDSDYLPQRQISHHWKQITGSMVVWISNVDTGAAQHYLTTYLTKDPGLDTSRAQLNRALKGIRMFQCFGSWTAIKFLKTSTGLKCESCNSVSWISEFEIRKAYTSGRPSPARARAQPARASRPPSPV